MPQEYELKIKVHLEPARWTPLAGPGRTAPVSQWLWLQHAEEQPQQPFRQQPAEDLGFSWSHDSPSVPGASNTRAHSHAHTNALRQRKGDKMAAGYL